MNDPYQTLGVSPSATDDEVKTAYRKLAMQYHPDRNKGSKTAEAKMKQINDAYASVMDMRKNGGAQTRSGYGASGPQGGYAQQQGYGGYGQQQQGYGGFEDFFSGFGFGGQQQRAYRAEARPDESPELTFARECLRTGRLMEARSALDGMRSRSGTWYYLSALTYRGMGNRAEALMHARQAVQLEPDNPDFNDLLNRMEGGSQTYRQNEANFGGVPNMLCRNPCVTCVALNLLCNLFSCCCRGC